jgi:hypothetical protein
MVGINRIKRRAIIMAGRFCLIPALALFFAAIATSNPAQANFTKAVYHGNAFCPKGTHFSVRKGGQCWSCPSGTKRTLLPITGKKACKRKSRKYYKKAAQIKKNKAACKKAGLIWRRKQCWSCEGYKRSLSFVTSPKACVQKVAAKHYKAKYVQDFGCGIGLYMSIKKFGQCFKCPAAHKFRTINKLTGPKACTNSFARVFAADVSGFCRSMVGGIVAGSQGVAKISQKVEQITDPIMAPVKKAAGGFSSKIKSPKELNKLLNRGVKPLLRNKEALQGLDRFAKKVNAQRTKIKRAMTNPKLVCDNHGRGLVKIFKSLDLLPRKRAGLFDGALIKTANASTGLRPHVALSLSNSGRSATTWRGATIGLTFVSNGDQHRIFLSFSPATYFATRAGYDITLSGMYFHRANISKFDLVDHLGMELGFSKGKWLDDWLDALTKKYPTRGAVLAWLPGGINISTDPLFRAFPGFGTNFISTDDPNEKNAGLGPFDVSVSFDVTFQLIKIR